MCKKENILSSPCFQAVGQTRIHGHFLKAKKNTEKGAYRQFLRKESISLDLIFK